MTTGWRADDPEPPWWVSVLLISVCAILLIGVGYAIGVVTR
jgi:hypothetical protein